MLSVAIIAKNEIQTLERTVLSIRDYADEVVIGVDAASSDGTKELAITLADKVVPIYITEELAIGGPRSISNSKDWGFSKARNDVLSQCKEGNWRLNLDGHEIVIHPEYMIDAIKKAEKSGCDGIETEILYGSDKNKIPSLSFKFARLTGPNVFYKNPIHNIPIFQRSCFYDGFKIERRKQDQNVKTKLERDIQRSSVNVRGFEKMIKDNPLDTRSWYYLATAYKDNGRWEDAINAFSKYIEIGTWKEERWHARVNMGACYSLLGNNDRAREQFSLALQEFPAYAEAYYYLADLAYKEKKYIEAQVWLEKCIQLDVPYCRLFVNPRIYLIDRFDKLSMVYNHLGQYGKAIEMAKKAIETTSIPRIENNIKIWKEWIIKHSGTHYNDVWAKKTKPCVLEIERFELMASLLKDSKNILDIGSGPGWIYDYIDKSSKYTAVDVSSYARTEVERRGGKAVQSLEDLGEETFDAVILGEVLEHLEDDVGMLLKIRKRLTNNAIIVVSIPRYGSMSDPAHTRDYTSKEIMDCLSVVGKPESIGVIGPWAIYKCNVFKMQP